MSVFKGDSFVIAGMSGAELAIRVMDVPDDEIVAPGYYFEKARNIGPDGCWHIING